MTHRKSENTNPDSRLKSQKTEAAIAFDAAADSAESGFFLSEKKRIVAVFTTYESNFMIVAGKY
ncbi:hypothetical protein [Holdemania filiformis]|uniref:hypothetical protein n=1 Tax=Holdemania filiformis TaxID=61171 RepID=UPI000E47B09C|nr:hypothetical protein [Holdemania filiformis]MBS5001255.1 hypothetical protein [Holdemania filiformis]